MAHDPSMSPQVQERMAAMLPELLGAVRWRRRRRQLGRVVLLLLVFVSLWVLADSDAATANGSVPQGVRQRVPQLASDTAATARAVPFACEIVGNDASVVQRYTAAVTSHQQWLVGDEELQAFLQDAHRPMGIVRVSGRVLVARAALDPFPLLAAE
jgi:hypothetical protein